MAKKNKLKKISQARKEEIEKKWPKLKKEIKALCLMREWARHELENMTQENDLCEKHSCILHYQTITQIMFAYNVDDVPEHIRDLSQHSLELMLHNLGIDPKEFV